MNTTKISLLITLILLAGTSIVRAQIAPEATTFSNPIGNGADPWMIKVDDKYYTCAARGRSIVITESRFMTKTERSAVVWHCPDSGWNSSNIWAPELHHVNGKWYVYYAAGSRAGSPFIHQRSGVLECSTPLGNYTDKAMLITGDDPSNADQNVWAIDVNVFRHDGQLYAVWSGWETQRETDQTAQHLYIARMANPWTLGKRHLISKAEESWELGEAFGLQEGPEALQNGNDLFIVYSTRGSWTKHYRLGYLKLKPGSNPLQASSWEKSPTAVFEGTATVHGVGHASFVQSPDGTENWVFYHTKKSEKEGWDRDIRLQPFTFDQSGNPVFGKPAEAGPMKRPSGETAIK